MTPWKNLDLFFPNHVVELDGELISSSALEEKDFTSYTQKVPIIQNGVRKGYTYIVYHNDGTVNRVVSLDVWPQQQFDGEPLLNIFAQHGVNSYIKSHYRYMPRAIAENLIK